MEVLTNLDINKDVVDNERQTPLHVAAANGNDEIVELFVETGALKTAVAAQKWTPLARAVTTTS